ncbi:MAG: c-type cytochrome [bacterium]|nr:c-type cytochrome [bacterium]
MKSLLKIFVALVFLFSSLACERDPKKPAYEFLPEMTRSVPYDAFAPNPNTPSGKTLLKPVAGTIPRGFTPYPYGADEEGLAQASRELKNPIPFSPEILAEGKELYNTFCLICHGAGGKGDGPLIPKYPNPPSFTSKSSKNLTPGALYHIMTKGSGEMASYASQVSPEDRWKIVYFVQVLQGKTPEEIKGESHEE